MTFVKLILYSRNVIVLDYFTYFNSKNVLLYKIFFVILRSEKGGMPVN